jgi:predicted amidophosphoribosyltransferase
MDQAVHKLDMVFCNKCGKPSPSRNRYCYDCGASLLAITCSFCSSVNPHFAHYCGACGKQLQPQLA